MFILLMIAITAPANSQYNSHGYLGKVNVVSWAMHDLVWADAVSVSYMHCFDRETALRLDFKYIHTDRDLVFETPGWLDIAPGRTIGTVQGSGWAFGLYSIANLATEISAPLGYYMAFGFEIHKGRTTEFIDQPLGRPTLMEGPPPTHYEYKHRGYRFMYDLGVRHILTSNLLVDLGMQFGMNITYKVTALGHDQMAIHRFPYERTGFFGKHRTKDEGVFKVPTVFYFNPTLRLGWVF